MVYRPRFPLDNCDPALCARRPPPREGSSPSYGGCFAVLGWMLVRRRRSGGEHPDRRATVVAVAALLHGLALVAVSLLPAPATSDAACVDGGRESRLTSLITFDEVQKTARGMGPSFLTSPSFLQVLANLVLFVPFGLLVGWRTRWSLLTAVAVGLGTSLVIELTQATGVWGLYACAYRYGDLLDLVTNTAGVRAGFVVGRHVLGRTQGRRPVSPH